MMKFVFWLIVLRSGPDFDQDMMLKHTYENAPACEARMMQHVVGERDVDGDLVLISTCIPVRRPTDKNSL